MLPVVGDVRDEQGVRDAADAAVDRFGGIDFWSAVNDRGLNWTTISGQGLPALTVPAGFTTTVHDRGPDGALLPPKPARLAVGMDVLALPFDEATVFTVAAAYEAASRKRLPPPDFGPVGD